MSADAGSDVLRSCTAGKRRLDRAASPRDDDLVDRYQRPARGFKACGELVARSLQRPLDLLAGAVQS